jgi:hypothetical protein
VRWATDGRSGVIYRILAVVLTCTPAIAFSLVPLVAERAGRDRWASSTSSCRPYILSLPI